MTKKAAPENTAFSSVTFNGVTVQASPVRPSSRDDKKYMRYVRHNDDERLVHWGQPDEQMERDVPERREAFNTRHSCDEKRDPFSPGFWACWHWQPGAKSEKQTYTHADVKRMREVLSGDDLDIFNSVFESAWNETGDNHKAFVAAMGAVNKSRYRVALKSTSDNPVVGGWAMLFTDSDNLDLDNEYFTKNTQTLLDFYQGAPLWMYHGRKGYQSHKPIGKRVSAEIYPRGIWMEHQLFPEHPLFQEAITRIERGELAYSSDSIIHYLDKQPDGEHRNWFIAGVSLVDKPAEPALGQVSLKSVNHALSHAAEAREARSGDEHMQDAGGKSNLKIARKEDRMTIDMQQLRAFLGMADATDDEVFAALESMIAEMRSKKMDDEKGMDNDDDAQRMSDDERKMMEEERESMKQVRLALALPDTATSTDVADALETVLQGAKAATAPKPRLNYNALAVVAKGMQVQNQVPAHTPIGKGFGAAAYIPQREQPKYPLGHAIKEAFKVHHKDLTAAKAQSVQLGSQGGFLLNHEVANEVIPALRDELVLTPLGADFITMDGQQSLTLPKTITEHTAFWVGEGDQVTASEETLGGITLFPRALAVRTIIPNQFLLNARINYEARIQEMAAYQIRRKLENSIFFGSGGGAEPAGLTNTTGVTSTVLSTNGRKPKLDDLVGMYGAVQDANVQFDESAGFVFAPRTQRTFTNLTDADGQPLLRQSWSRGVEETLLGYNYEMTNNIPIDQTAGNGTALSSIFFGIWRYLKIGISNEMELFIDPYTRSDRLQTQIIMHMYADFTVEYPEAFEIRTAVAA